MTFICTPLTQQRDSRASRAATAEGIWVRFLVEFVFRRKLDAESRALLSPYLQDSLQTLAQRKLLLRQPDAPAVQEIKYDADGGWMMALPVLELRFNQVIPLDGEVRHQLAAAIEEGLNLAIREGRILGGQRQYEPLSAWVRAHPDQRCWPSPSLL
jgi:hypothetical protein